MAPPHLPSHVWGVTGPDPARESGRVLIPELSVPQPLLSELWPYAPPLPCAPPPALNPVSCLSVPSPGSGPLGPGRGRTPGTWPGCRGAGRCTLSRERPPPALGPTLREMWAGGWNGLSQAAILVLSVSCAGGAAALRVIFAHNGRGMYGIINSTACPTCLRSGPRRLRCRCHRVGGGPWAWPGSLVSGSSSRPRPLPHPRDSCPRK